MVERLAIAKSARFKPFAAARSNAHAEYTLSVSKQAMREDRKFPSTHTHRVSIGNYSPFNWDTS